MGAKIFGAFMPGAMAAGGLDPVAAAAARRKILAYAAAHNAAIGGMHLPYPALGTVVPAR